MKLNKKQEDHILEESREEHFDAKEITEEFFKRRFSNKDIEFEKKCGYFGVWVDRFETLRPEDYMDEESKKVWKEMQNTCVFCNKQLNDSDGLNSNSCQECE